MAAARRVKASAPNGKEKLLRPLGPLLAAMLLGFVTVSAPLAALPLHVPVTLGCGMALAGLKGTGCSLVFPVLGALAEVSGPSCIFLIGAAAAAVGIVVSLAIEPGHPAQA